MSSFSADKKALLPLPEHEGFAQVEASINVLSCTTFAGTKTSTSARRIVLLHKYWVKSQATSCVAVFPEVGTDQPHLLDRPYLVLAGSTLPWRLESVVHSTLVLRRKQLPVKSWRKWEMRRRKKLLCSCSIQYCSLVRTTSFCRYVVQCCVMDSLFFLK